jgi:ribosomal protein S18 acetylase RimI-like enzyme
MRVNLLPDAGAFLERTRHFRAREPYLTNVIGTTATSVASGLSTFEKTSWWVVEDSNVVVGMLMRTAPHNLVLSPMPANAIGPAVQAVLLDDPGIPGASGPKELCESFLSLFALRSGRAPRRAVERNLFVYVLGTLVAPSPVAGSLRQCTGKDFEQLLPWWQGFANDAGVQRHGLEEGLALSLAQGRVYVWMRDDEAVCAVAHSPIVATPGGSVARVAPVYTPPEERRRGYGARLTFEVSSLLVDQGHGLMLFTDAANPTSNGVYRRLGYEKVDELVECSLEPTQGERLRDA